MKKITDKEIAEFLNITRQSVFYMKKNKPQQYEAIKIFLFLQKNNFFKDFKKIKNLSELVVQEANKSNYTNDLMKLVKKIDEVISSIPKKETDG